MKMIIEWLQNNYEWIFSGIGGVVLAALAGFIFRKRGSGQGDIKAGRDVIIGTTPEQLKMVLREFEEEKRKEISLLPPGDKQRDILERELKEAQNKLENLQASYEKEKALRKETKKVLQQFKDQLPAQRIEKALAELREGADTKAVEETLDKVERKGSSSSALAAYQSGLLAKNRIDYTKAMERFQRAVTLEKDNTTYLLKAGQMARTVADYKQSQIWLEHLLQLLEHQGENEELATALNEMAGLYEAQGKYEQAEPLYQRSLSITEKALGKDHPSVAATLNNLAGLYRTQGKYEQAEPLFQRALSITEKALGKDHPSVAATLNNLAELYRTQGRYELMEPFFQRSLSITEKALGKDHPSLATTLNNLAALYYAQGKYEQAEPLYQRSLSIREKTLGKDHPEVATTLNNLAGLYYAQGKYEQAEPLFQRSLEIFKKVFPQGHPNIDVIEANYAELKRQMEAK